METLYFSWERSAAVLVQISSEEVKGYILPVLKEAGGWIEATEGQIKDFFIDGSRISKSEFEKNFGIIGHDIPEIPVVT